MAGGAATVKVELDVEWLPTPRLAHIPGGQGDGGGGMRVAAIPPRALTDPRGESTFIISPRARTVQ